MSVSSFRHAEAADLPAIARLEAAAFDGPWSRPIYAEEIRRPSSVVDLALALDGTLLGLSCSWHVAGECHLLRIATHPQARRRGVATGLLARVIDDARRRRASSVMLEVASLNETAVRLYERAGFVTVGRRPGYYRRPVDDALLMTLELRPTA